MSFFIKRTYNSLTEVIKQIETKPYNKLFTNYNHYLKRSDAKNFEFTQSESLVDALNILKAGWKKGKDIIEKLTKEHEDAFVKLFPRQDFDLQLQPEISGEIVNVEATIMNLPENMLSFHQDEEKLRKLQSGKLQRIIISGEIPHHIDADTIFNRGAIISSMINIMELYGFRTELWLCHIRTGFNKNESVQYFYKIKPFDNNLDLGLLAFVSAHPSMIRRINFALLEQEENDDVINNICRNCYGLCTDLNEKEIKEFGGDLNYGNIYFEKLSNNKPFVNLLEETKVKIQQHFTSIKI